MKSEKPTYAAIPARAMADYRLSALDFRVLMVIALHDRFSANGLGCYASHQRLAALVDCHLKSLSRSLRTLAGLRYITVNRSPFGDGRSRAYKVVYDDLDRSWFDAGGIGNRPATYPHEEGNEIATDDAEIGNDPSPCDEEIGNRPAEKGLMDQDDTRDNIFSETERDPVETRRHPSESAQRSSGGSVVKANLRSVLGLIERNILAGKRHDSDRRYLDFAASVDASSEAQWATRLIHSWEAR